MVHTQPVAVILGLALVASAVTASADPPASRGRGRRHRGRAAAPATPPEVALPQECGMDPFHADYGGLEAGARIRLGRHREVNGDEFWADAMEPFVGRVTTIRGPRGVDEQGCPLVSVAVDDGEYDWRVRDLSVVAEGERDARASANLSPGFAGDPRTFEGHLSTEMRASGLHEGCAGYTSRAATLRLTLTDDFETIALLAHADVDLVMVVHTPGDEWICADDVDDLDPVVAGTAGEGAYEIWVGGYEEDTEGASFRLGVTEKLTVRTSDLVDATATELGRGDDAPTTNDGDDADEAPEGDDDSGRR